MAARIVRKRKTETEIPPPKPPPRPQVDTAIENIGGAIGIASLLATTEGEIEGTKDGTLQLVGDALLSLLRKAFDALAPDD
jgi:hypothetical protein